MVAAWTSLFFRSTVPVVFLLCLLCVLGCDGAPPAETEASAPRSLAEIEDLREPDSAELRQALEAADPSRRARAALAMGRIQSPAYALSLTSAAQVDEDKAVRRAALFALGQLGLAQDVEAPSAALDAALAMLDEENPELLAAAIEAVGKLAPEGAAERLASFLSHADPTVRGEAAMALFRCRFAPVWRRQSTEPPELPAVAIQGLIEALGDPDRGVRWKAAHAFSRYAQPEAGEALAQRLGDADEWVRLFSVRGLGRIASSEHVPALVASLTDPSPRVRTEAVRALVACGAPERLPAKLAKDESFQVRAALAESLGHEKAAARSLKTLRRLEKDESPTVRTAAVLALAARLGEAFATEQGAYLEAEEWWLRAAAARAAGFSGEGALALLERAFQDDDARVRTAAVEVVGDLEGADDLLLRALSADDLAVRGTAVGGVAERPHPERLRRLEQAYDASPGVESIEIREEIVKAVNELEEDEREQAGAWLRRIATTDTAASVRSLARHALGDAAAELPPASAPAPEPSPFLGRTFEENPLVRLETDKGAITIKCLANEAPIHVASFVERVEEGFYDGLIWHRVVPSFVIQGGDPRGDGWGGPGYTLRDEVHAARYLRGAVGMPKAGKDTGGGQLFITHIPTPHLDGNYTIFGRVTEGRDVVDRLEVGDRILRALWVR